MLLPVKAITLKKPRKDGNFLIYFQYCYSSTKRVLLNTEIAVPFQFWNKKRQCISKLMPEEFGNVDRLNVELTRQKKIIEALIEKGIQENAANLGTYVKERFSPTLQTEQVKDVPTFTTEKPELDFFTQLNAFTKSKEKQICPEAMAHFKALKEHLLAYERSRNIQMTFSILDYNFYMDFVEFLTYEYQLCRKKVPEYGLKTSTIGRTIKKLRMFIKDRVRRKIISPIDLEDFKIIDEESDAIYLSYEEIGKIYVLDLSEHEHLIKDRDLFVLGCLTGMRFSDYSTLRPEDLRGGLLYKKTNKSDSWVVIPMREEAKAIFDMHFKETAPTLSNPVFNKNIKIIAALAGITELVTFSYKKGNKSITTTKPKAEWVTSHSCRRSFCTNEFLAGTEISLIMRISGHKTIKEFFKYIRITPEAAARQIQEIWLTRNNMQAFALPKSA